MQQLTRDLHIIADYVSRVPLDPHHAAFAGCKDDLDFYTVMGCYQPTAYLIGAGCVWYGGLAAAVPFSFQLNITMTVLKLQCLYFAGEKTV
jgi:hypothetical protein